MGHTGLGGGGVWYKSLRKGSCLFIATTYEFSIKHLVVLEPSWSVKIAFGKKRRAERRARTNWSPPTPVHLSLAALNPDDHQSIMAVASLAPPKSHTHLTSLLSNSNPELHREKVSRKCSSNLAMLTQHKPAQFHNVELRIWHDWPPGISQRPWNWSDILVR